METAPPLTSGPAAKLIDCGRTWLHSLDHVLRPRRTSTGVRLYALRAVLAYAARRDCARARRAA